MSHEELTDFKEGQWWVAELDAASKSGSDDLKRAVAVVHNLLRSAAHMQTKAEVLFHERENARARLDKSVRMLSGIHALLYPEPLTLPDGRTMVFRPKGDYPHELLQELSNRIRAIPDELGAHINGTCSGCKHWGNLSPLKGSSHANNGMSAT